MGGECFYFRILCLCADKGRKSPTVGYIKSCYSWCRAGYMLYLIERAKKCLDFSATLFIIHLFICIIYGGWPSSITWWVVNGTGLAVTSLLGEYLCIRRELREIPIARYRPSVWPIGETPPTKASLIRVYGLFLWMMFWMLSCTKLG